MALSQDIGAETGSSRGVEERLLDAAEELFCEHGYRGTSVRELAAAAGCNVASVNYYFGGKDNLYVEVWRRYLQILRERRIVSIDRVMSENEGKPELEDLLKSFAEAVLGPLIEEQRGRQFMKLMAREMLDQHLPANMFVEEIIVPTLSAMEEALVRICPGLDASEVGLIVYSIIAQLVHAIRLKPFVAHRENGEVIKFDLPGLVDHIVKFSAAGVRGYMEGKGK